MNEGWKGAPSKQRGVKERVRNRGIRKTKQWTPTARGGEVVGEGRQPTRTQRLGSPAPRKSLLPPLAPPSLKKKPNR